MTAKGAVKNGVVEPEPGVTLPEGMQVQVVPAAVDGPSVGEALSPFFGCIDDADIPSDFVSSLDYYLYGTPTE